MSKINEIEVALAIVRSILGSNLSNKEYSEIINRDFGLDSTEQDINYLFEPSIEMDVEDLQLIWKNIS